MEPKSLAASLMSNGSSHILASLTLADAIVIAAVIFVATFLLGWCGMVWSGGAGGHTQQML